MKYISKASAPFSNSAISAALHRRQQGRGVLQAACSQPAFCLRAGTGSTDQQPLGLPKPTFNPFFPNSSPVRNSTAKHCCVRSRSELSCCLAKLAKISVRVQIQTSAKHTDKQPVPGENTSPPKVTRDLCRVRFAEVKTSGSLSILSPPNHTTNIQTSKLKPRAEHGLLQAASQQIPAHWERTLAEPGNKLCYSNHLGLE